MLRDERHRSVSRACCTVGITRSGFRYIPRRRLKDEPLIEAIKEAATRHRRWGLPRLHNKLRKAGHVINQKRTARVYRELGLQVRKRRRKRLTRVPRVVRPKPTRPNECWSMDFVHDWTLEKRKLKCLTIVDDLSKESPGIAADHSLSGEDVVRFLDSLPLLPERIRTDNGPEFGSRAFQEWIEAKGIDHEFITPGKPNENAYIESFNSRFRDECLNEHVFRDLKDARQKIEKWRTEDYNELHPHSSLGMLTPKEFATSWKDMLPGAAV